MLSEKLSTHFQQNLAQWLVSIFTGLFMFIVLFFFKAYDIQQGVSYSGHSLLFRAIAFGVITSITFSFNEFYIARFFSLKSLKQQLIWRMWEVWLATGIIFLLFNYFWNGTEWWWSAYFLLLGECSLVLFFPIAFVHILIEKQKTDLPITEQKLIFQSENGKQKLLLHPAQLLYLKSEDNYVRIVYLLANQVKYELHRNSLKNIEVQYVDTPFMVRCHRSYMVNPQQIHRVILQNRQFQLDVGYDELVPVSKKYQEKFK